MGKNTNLDPVLLNDSQSIFHERAGITDYAQFTHLSLARKFSLSIHCAQHKHRINHLPFLHLLSFSFLPKEVFPQNWGISSANQALPQQNLSDHLGKVILSFQDIAPTGNLFSTRNRNEILLLWQGTNTAQKDKTGLNLSASSALWQILCYFNLIYKIATNYWVPDTIKNCISPFNWYSGLSTGKPRTTGHRYLWIYFLVTCILPPNCCYYFSFSSFPTPHFLHFAVFSFDCLHFPSWGKNYLGHPKTLRKHLKESCLSTLTHTICQWCFHFWGINPRNHQTDSWYMIDLYSWINCTILCTWQRKLCCIYVYIRWLTFLSMATYIYMQKI